MHNIPHGGHYSHFPPHFFLVVFLFQKIVEREKYFSPFLSLCRWRFYEYGISGDLSLARMISYFSPLPFLFTLLDGETKRSERQSTRGPGNGTCGALFKKRRQEFLRPGPYYFHFDFQSWFFTLASVNDDASIFYLSEVSRAVERQTKRWISLQSDRWVVMLAALLSRDSRLNSQWWPELTRT